MGNVFCCQDDARDELGRQDGYEALFNLNEPARNTRDSVVDVADASATSRWVSSGTFSDQFELGVQLGKGSTASCHACRHLATGQAYAVKIINKKRISVMYSDLLPQFRREVDILARLEHPHIIRLHQVFESVDRIHVVTELARGGELFEYLVSRPNSVLTEAIVSFLLRQCFSAAAYMHEHRVIHRDIKLENILLAEPPHGDGANAYESIQLKMIDFGLAKSFQEGPCRGGPGAQLRTAKTFFGTVGYIAPEMMRRKAYTDAVDVWALGVVAFVLLCGVFPFDDNGKRHRQQIDYRLRFPSWVSGLSSSAKDLLGKLLHVDPAQRITAAQALSHPWVSGRTASPRHVLSSPGHLRGLRSPPVITPVIGNVDDAATSSLMILSSIRDEDLSEGVVSPLVLSRPANGGPQGSSARVRAAGGAQSIEAKRHSSSTRRAAGHSRLETVKDEGEVESGGGGVGVAADNNDKDKDNNEDESGGGGVGGDADNNGKDKDNNEDDDDDSAHSSSSSSLGSPSLSSFATPPLDRNRG